ncbi:CGNR zinc finger domain-containing protein [Micrococcus aloeverae]|uniref:CGNR zinc finger domain-containing protein n=1 Tax=Micrococcus aloeverae TaxID=1391911 RepID=UPI00141AEAB5|nr:CGNR zinc finger domain-containing protein [Micrococcus aloeverae]
MRTFVNTLDIEKGTDVLDCAEQWGQWCAERALPTESSAIDREVLGQLREALREGLLAHHSRSSIPPAAREVLDQTLTWSQAEAIFTEEGLRLIPPREGARHVAGRILSLVVIAMADGTWSRLKACRDDECKWAFYDHSRSRTGQWCSMAICGNRNKQARLRKRRAQ